MARAVAALDLELVMSRGRPGGAAKAALREPVDGHALLHSDPLTIEMLKALGSGPVVESKEEPQQRQ